MEDKQIAQRSKNASILLARQEISSLPRREFEISLACMDKYGTDFLGDVCPQFPSMHKDKIYPTMSSAIRANAPCVQLADRVWGDVQYKGKSVKCSEAWLIVQLTEVMAYLGLRDKMTDFQIRTTAGLLHSEAIPKCVTLAEFMQFFLRFEQGYYNKFHGYERPNPQEINESFQTFLDELVVVRRRVKEDVERERSAREYEQMIADRVDMPENIKRKWDARHNMFGTLEKSEHIPVTNDFSVKYIVRCNGEDSQPLNSIDLAEHLKGITDKDYTIIKYIG